MIGELCPVCSLRFSRHTVPHASISENMATQRANTLLAILPLALETGFSEIDPEPVPLKVGILTIKEALRQTKKFRTSMRTL